jgi:transposase
MICQPGAPCIGTSAPGATKGSGLRSCTPYANRCGKSKAEILNPAQRSSIVNRSKPVPFEVPRRASIWGKKIWGRKRHVLVDTQGNLLEVKVTAAEASDQQGAKNMLEPLKPLLARMKLLWGDSHYGGALMEWIKEHLGWNVQVVRGLITTKTTSRTRKATTQKDQKNAVGGFQILPRRWVVERSLAWITRWRRLARDHEGLPASSEAFIKLAASRRMLSLLAPPFP